MQDQDDCYNDGIQSCALQHDEGNVIEAEGIDVQTNCAGLLVLAHQIIDNETRGDKVGRQLKGNLCGKHRS